MGPFSKQQFSSQCLSSYFVDDITKLSSIENYEDSVLSSGFATALAVKNAIIGSEPYSYQLVSADIFIPENFDSTKSYQLGDYVSVDGVSYIRTSISTSESGEWSVISSDFTQNTKRCTELSPRTVSRIHSLENANTVEISVAVPHENTINDYIIRFDQPYTSVASFTYIPKSGSFSSQIVTGETEFTLSGKYQTVLLVVPTENDGRYELIITNKKLS